MNNTSTLKFILTGLLLIVLATACNAGAPSEAPTVAAHPATETIAPRPTDEPTAAVTEGPAPIPSPTSDGSPFPVTWVAYPYTTSDGRSVFGVEDRQVLRNAQTVFEQWQHVVFFHDRELTPRDEYETQLREVLSAEREDWIEALLKTYDEWTVTNGGFWSHPPIDESYFNWTSGVAEFNDKGDEVFLTVTTAKEHNEWVDVTSGQVIYVQDNEEASWKVLVRYDRQSGKWILYDADSTQPGGKVIKVTTTP